MLGEAVPTWSAEKSVCITRVQEMRDESGGTVRRVTPRKLVGARP